MEEIKKLVLSEFEKGNIIIASHEGLSKINLEDFIDEFVDGMLYDLNRNEAVVLTLIEDPKWINDFAVCKVIRALKYRIDELEQQLHINDVLNN